MCGGVSGFESVHDVGPRQFEPVPLRRAHGIAIGAPAPVGERRFLLVRDGLALEASRHRGYRARMRQAIQAGGPSNTASQAAATAFLRTMVQSSVRPMSRRIGQGNL